MIVDTVEELLRRARAGKYKGIAFACICENGSVEHGHFIPGGATTFEALALAAVVEVVKQRLLSQEDGWHDDVDVGPAKDLDS